MPTDNTSNTNTIRPSELNITQEGVPAGIPAEACYLGWQESLALLAKLVEAGNPDQPRNLL